MIEKNRMLSLNKAISYVLLAKQEQFLHLSHEF